MTPLLLVVAVMVRNSLASPALYPVPSLAELNASLPRYTYRSLLSGNYFRLPAAFAGVRVLDPDCVLPGLHCLPDQSNVVDVFFGVGSASECQLSCAYHTGRCRLFTWFDAAHPTFPRSCFLYTSCAAAGRSEHSLTGPATCTCGEKKACQGVRHNFVGFQENVGTEAACQALCRAESECKFYTWFNTDNRVFFNYCFLFSSCDKVSCNCVGCSAGPPSCAPQIPSILTPPYPAPAPVSPAGLSVSAALPAPPQAGDTNIEITAENEDRVSINLGSHTTEQVLEAGPELGQLHLDVNTTNTQSNSSESALKATVLNYLPSLKWLFVFIDD